MMVYPTSPNNSTASLTQKLHDLGRLKPKSEQKEEKEFEIVYMPDRPARLVTPVEAPTEEECGDDIVRWRRALVKEQRGISPGRQYDNMDMPGHRSPRHHQGRVGKERRPQRGCVMQVPALTGLTLLDDSSVTTESDDDGEGHIQDQHRHATSSTEKLHASSMHSAGPTPFFTGTATSSPPATNARSPGPSLATVMGKNNLAETRYTGGRKEAKKAPPRLGQRPFLEIGQRGERTRATTHRGLTRHEAIPNLRVEAPTPTDAEKPVGFPQAALPPPPLSQRRLLPQQSRKSPSPSNTVRTIWPSPLGIYDPKRIEQPSPTPEREKYSEKPLPAPPAPPTRSQRRPAPAPLPATPISASISERHQQLYRQQHQQQHIASQMKIKTTSTPGSSLSSSPLSKGSSTSTSTPSRKSPSPSPHIHIPASRFRDVNNEGLKSRPGRSPSLKVSDDDADFLAWKKPAERARSEREVREKGDSADLFLEIIEQYDDAVVEREGWRGWRTGLEVGRGGMGIGGG
ncbi:hypothetical protein C8A03DRAFT_14847 [Achaetomium macrosporum]|uniref:Uncharacterized protein n=1 Tax=Achaetomium macrosporum TaxID=79813 RepID=A0AAN7H7H4_9PEZI|nr:hypothetical protein C8A03DRAFT_14847 [Achaetomium macrosporum]